MTRLSIVIITYNEERIIHQVLESIRWCDEIIIVDSLSTDNTLNICKEYSNCKIYTQAFLGYGAQKKFAVNLATNDWVLSIDGDEVLSPELINELKTLFSNDILTYNAYYIPRTHIFLGKVFKYGREHKHYYLRLFNKKFGNFNTDNIHERLIVEGKKGKLKEPLMHNSYENIHHYFEKLNKYTSIAAENMIESKKSISKVGLVLKVPFSFFKYYIIDRNFLNGYAGFVWAVFSSLYKTVRNAKYIELKEKNARLSIYDYQNIDN